MDLLNFVVECRNSQQQVGTLVYVVDEVQKDEDTISRSLFCRGFQPFNDLTGSIVQITGAAGVVERYEKAPSTNQLVSTGGTHADIFAHCTKVAASGSFQYAGIA